MLFQKAKFPSNSCVDFIYKTLRKEDASLSLFLSKIIQPSIPHTASGSRRLPGCLRLCVFRYWPPAHGESSSFPGSRWIRLIYWYKRCRAFLSINAPTRMSLFAFWFFSACFDFSHAENPRLPSVTLSSKFSSPT